MSGIAPAGDVDVLVVGAGPVGLMLAIDLGRRGVPAVDEHREVIAATASVYNRRVYEMIGVELGYRYAGSDLIADEPNNIEDWDTLVYTPHPRPRGRLPHVWLSDGAATRS